MNRRRQQLHGLGAIALLALLVLGIPVALIAIGVAPWDADLNRLRTTLTSPDDGTLALAVFAVAAWVAWTVMAMSIIVETVSKARGLRPPQIPGLAVPQQTAAQLVATAALLFVAAPAALAAFPAPPAHAAAGPPVLVEETSPTAPVPKETSAPVPTIASPGPDRATADYTVKRGDSLWKIAEQVLGDGSRYTEIVDLNPKQLDGRPDFIMAGTVLKIPHEPEPADADGRASDEYVVRRGDTLSEIAEAELGDARLYPRIVEASRSTEQPDGAHLTDPDLIRPGWTLTVPESTPAKNHRTEPSQDAQAPVAQALPVPAPVAPPVPESSPDRTTEPTPPVDTPSASAGTRDDADEQSTPGWMVPGLTGAGTLLAGAILLTVRAHRRTQLRYRRPRQTPPPPPPELRPVEKTTFVAGTPAAATIEALDRALRHLAATTSTERHPLPALKTVELANGRATLHLADDAMLPAPWQGTGSTWTAVLGDELPDEDVFAPYPMLVSVGQDSDGHLWLVNLERLGAVALAGDVDRATALGRHIAAELALNPWSVLVEVDTLGLGEELAVLDPFRLRAHAAGDSKVVETIVSDLRAGLSSPLDPPDPPDPLRVVVANDTATTKPVVSLIESVNIRLGVAVVSITQDEGPDSAFVLTADGRLSVPALGLEVTAAGLTSDEAAACAAIVNLTREAEPGPTPAMAIAADDWRDFADHAGALRSELTEGRGPGPTGDTSTLPRAAAEYEVAAATTAADIEALAPVVPPHVRRSVEKADPTLDDEVAAWFDPDCPLPRLVLLGPVRALAHGDTDAVAKRRPYFLELLAFLALHPEGVTAKTIAAAFQIGQSRARTDVGFIRDWLGTNPKTDRPHLPPGRSSRVSVENGTAGYQVEDLLVDLDLFRRLRVRGDARGADGIADLVTALNLVAGQPFDQLRERGWGWLFDDERLHDIITSAIVDTAHIVVVDALLRGDLIQARSAAETACRASPYDEVCRLDLIRVLQEQGHNRLAEQMLTMDVFNRTDDYLAPIDLPDRTAQVVNNQRWVHERGETGDM